MGSICCSKNNSMNLVYSSGVIDLNKIDDNGHSTLIKLVYDGNYALIKKSININTNLDFQNIMGETSLMMALSYNKMKISKLLINYGADVNIMKNFNNGDSALDIAIIHDNVDMVELLIEKKAFLDKPNEFGNTPLLTSIYNNQHQIAKLLIKNNANINLANHKGFDAYTLAILSNKKKISDYILKTI